MELALELEGVTRRWRGGFALEEIDLRVPRGAVVGLLGPSGSGKTTALRIALGLLTPDSGRATVLGVPAARIAARAGRIGVVLDGPALEPDLTVRENLVLHTLRHGAGRRDPASLLDALGLAALSKRRTRRLSQGEAQRVALARALLLEPELLVLDEPVAHLDPALTSTVLALLRELADQRGTAVLLSGHQLNEIERAATHIVLLSRGHVVLAGALDELLGKSTQILRIVAQPSIRALVLLAEHPAVTRVEAVRDDGVEHLRAAIRDGAAAEINSALHAAGIAVSELTLARPSLAELVARALAHEPPPRRERTIGGTA